MHPALIELENFMHPLLQMLKSDTVIPEDPFFEAVGRFSKQLKVVLREYFTANSLLQAKMRPYVNYYRQLQNYLVFILRFPTILVVPHHSEIEQTVRFMEQKNLLIQTVYIELSQHEYELLKGDFHENLDRLLSKRNDSKDLKRSKI